jgi:hypothetical protein
VPASAESLGQIVRRPEGLTLLAQDGRTTESAEIERILAADNLDSSKLSAREIADTIRAIPRGEAPDDFWAAYQAHVSAWRRAADAEDTLNKMDISESEIERASTALAEANMDIESTFAEVARIAESYGVAMPEPPAAPFDENTI